ncbi:unnamed protein product [Boreogadus saida]
MVKCTERAHDLVHCINCSSPFQLIRFSIRKQSHQQARGRELSLGGCAKHVHFNRCASEQQNSEGLELHQMFS